MESGVLFKGRQVLIPRSMQKDILEQLHEGHQGNEKTRRLTCQSVNWINTNKDVERICNSCETCQEHQNTHRKEPLIPHKLPMRTWQFIVSDLFEIDNRQYLLITDRYSKYLLVDEICMPVTNQSVTDRLKSYYALLGRPDDWQWTTVQWTVVQEICWFMRNQPCDKFLSLHTQQQSHRKKCMTHQTDHQDHPKPRRCAANTVKFACHSDRYKVAITRRDDLWYTYRNPSTTVKHACTHRTAWTNGPIASQHERSSWPIKSTRWLATLVHRPEGEDPGQDHQDLVLRDCRWEMPRTQELHFGNNERNRCQVQPQSPSWYDRTKKISEFRRWV